MIWGVFPLFLLFFYYFFVSFIFKKIFKRFYLFINERHTQREADTSGEGEAGSMQEPSVGPDPGTPGSHAGPKVALNS